MKKFSVSSFCDVHHSGIERLFSDDDPENEPPTEIPENPDDPDQPDNRTNPTP